MQPDIIGIADRRDGGETIQCAAQDDDDEARIAAAGCGMREFGQIGPGGEGGTGQQESATA